MLPSTRFSKLSLLAGAAALAMSCGHGKTTSSSTTSGSSSGSGGSGGHLVCNAPSITKGPWSLGVDDTSAKIRWEACAPGTPSTVTFASEGTGGSMSAISTETPIMLTTTYPAKLNASAPPDYAGTYYTHEAALTNLMPGTCYAYHLDADPTRKGRVCTAHPSGATFKFMAIGDTNPALGTTAPTLAHVLPEAPEFTVHGGDIQYYDSLLETWASWFPVMQPMLSQGAFFAAIGNHESEMSDELSDYSLRFFGGAGFNGGDTYYRFENGGVWFFSLNTQDPVTQGSPQAIWLEQQLADVSTKPGYRFSVVFFHRPFLTCGDTDDNIPAQMYFEPLFLQYGVKLVLQAHMHGYERFELADGLTYITTAGGGGHIADPNMNVSRSYCSSRVASGAFYHAVIFTVAPGSIAGKVIDQDGAVRDTFTKTVP